MRYRLALLLILMCVSTRVIFAQDSSSTSDCSHVPAPHSNSNPSYNSGFSDGYKTGCRHGLSEQQSNSGGELDEAVSDTPAPSRSQANLAVVNQDLLRSLRKVCSRLVQRELNAERGQDEAGIVQNRAKLLRILAEDPSRCQ